jgi:hypothetical protein
VAGGRRPRRQGRPHRAVRTRSQPWASRGRRARHERAAVDAGGVVLRYGHFYGPGTYLPAEQTPEPRIHVHEAARRTAELLDTPSGIVEVVENPAA